MKKLLLTNLLLLIIVILPLNSFSQYQIVDPHYDVCPGDFPLGIYTVNNGATWTLEKFYPIGPGIWIQEYSGSYPGFHIQTPGTYKVSFAFGWGGGSQVFTVSEAPPSGLHALSHVAYCSGNAPSTVGYIGLNTSSIDYVIANWKKNNQIIAANTMNLTVPFQGDGLYCVEIETSFGCSEEYCFNVNQASGSGLAPISTIDYCGALANPSLIGWSGVDPVTVDVTNLNWFYDFGNGFNSQLPYSNIFEIPYLGSNTYTAVVTTSNGCQETYNITTNDICCDQWSWGPVASSPTYDFARVGPNGNNSYTSCTGTSVTFTGTHPYVQTYGYFQKLWEVTNLTTGQTVNINPNDQINCSFPTVLGNTYKIRFSVFDNSAKCEKYQNTFQWTANCSPRGGFGRKTEEATDEELSIIAYPNPSKGEFNLTLPDIENTVHVYDMAGAKIKEIVSIGNSLLDLSDHGSGLYIVQVINTNGVQQLRLNVQK